METATNDIMDAAHTAHARANRLKETANNIKALAFDSAVASSDQSDALRDALGKHTLAAHHQVTQLSTAVADLLATLDAHAKGADTEGSVL